jgi:hypothetical protein
MTESYTVGLQSPAAMASLMRAPFKRRLVVPAVVIFILAGMAGCFAYFVVAPAPLSQSAALAAPSERAAWSSTVGQARETDALTVVDRPRPSDEDIVKAFRLATEDPQPVVTSDVGLDPDQPPPIAKPVPLPKRRPLPRPWLYRKLRLIEWTRLVRKLEKLGALTLGFNSFHLFGKLLPFFRSQSWFRLPREGLAIFGLQPLKNPHIIIA